MQRNAHLLNECVFDEPATFLEKIWK